MVQGNLIKIIVAENQRLVKEGIIQLLNSIPHLIVIDEAEDGAETLSKCKKNPPDIVLLDMCISNPEILPTVEAIEELNSKIKIILMSLSEDQEICRTRLWDLTKGVISKNICPNELNLAIKSVMLGDVFLFRFSQKPFKPETVTKQKLIELEGLTKRENEILYCLAKGFTSKEIAEKLYVSTRTVETHRSKIIQKYNLHSSTELVHFAHEVLSKNEEEHKLV
ncbi:MAG: response regulator transcription factor [Ignavibacteriales bacterium]|nr:MAG: response regulator transcription factor [Ignavibacteriales bacterium]